MPAATLPHSRSARIPLAARHNLNDFGAERSVASALASDAGRDDEWGPSSVPPSSQSNVPWDEQVVPALRRKLEQESRDLSKRISRIEESDHGWASSAARSREAIDRRDKSAVYVRDSHDSSHRMSREIVHTHRESSIEQFHNRFATMRAPSRSQADNAASSFPFAAPEPNHDDHPTAARGAARGPRSSGSSSEATQKAREKARQIAARQQAARQNYTSTDSMPSSSDLQPPAESSVDTIPEHDESAPRLVGSSFERRRLRTQSTPMRPSIDQANANGSSSTDHDGTRRQNASSSTAAAPPPQGGGHQRTSSLSRRKAAAAAAMDPKLMEEFGPLGSTPSPRAKLMAAHLDNYGSASPSVRNRAIQPDAFKSLSPDRPPSPERRGRGMREASAPPTFGEAGRVDEFGVAALGTSPGSRSVSNWEDQIIPTVARKLQQEQFLADGRRFSRYDTLIDTWDRNGLPLSHTDFAAQQRARRAEEEHQAAQQHLVAQQQVAAHDEEAIVEQRTEAEEPHRTGLSPVEASFNRSRSRASSRRSQRSAQTPHQPTAPQRAEQLPMHELRTEPVQQAYPAAHAQPAVRPSGAPTTPVTRRDEALGESGCCCTVM